MNMTFLRVIYTVWRTIVCILFIAKWFIAIDALGFLAWCECIKWTSAESTHTQIQCFDVNKTRCESWWWWSISWNGICVHTDIRICTEFMCGSFHRNNGIASFSHCAIRITTNRQMLSNTLEYQLEFCDEVLRCRFDGENIRLQMISVVFIVCYSQPVKCVVEIHWAHLSYFH